MNDPQWMSWIIEIRTRLSAPLARRLPPSSARQAAVLVPLYVEAGELWTVLSKRSESLPHHQGQIAFPGGSLESDEDVWDAALREAHEEAGIAPQRVLRLGQLDEAETPSGFRIVPCVGAIPFPFETQINHAEIDELFSVPLVAFLNPTLVESQILEFQGKQYQVPIYHFGRHRIWGLTARIIQNLLQRLELAAAEPPN